jgi:hypothetical protein
VSFEQAVFKLEPLEVLPVTIENVVSVDDDFTTEPNI